MENTKNELITSDEEKTLKEAALTYLQNNNSGLTQGQMKEFILLCLEHKLNPLKREIYAVNYAGKFNVITSYYEFLKRADRTGLLEYSNVEIIDDDKHQPIKAIFTGKRKDQKKELRMEFYFNEFSTGKSTWLTKPHFMIDKVAIANGLRRLFPNELANMPYVSEELWYWNSENDKVIKEHCFNDKFGKAFKLKEIAVKYPGEPIKVFNDPDKEKNE